MYTITLINITLFLIINEIRSNTIFVTDQPIIQIGSRIYKKELLTSSYIHPKELAFDPFTRNLYFMYMDSEIQNSGRAFINIDSKINGKINGIKFNKATAVDELNGDVYFGSEDGLYKYDYENNIAVNIGLYNVNVLKIVIRNGVIYLIDANNHMLYKVVDNGTSMYKVGNWKTVMEFDVDYEDNYHFVTMCGVFCAKTRHEVVKIDIDAVHHYMIQKEFTLGINVDTIYKIDCNNGTAEKLVRLDFIPSSIIFGDDGDIIYSVEDEIYRLKPVTYYYLYTIRRRGYKNQRL